MLSHPVFKRNLVYIFLTALTFCVVFNEINRSYIKRTNPDNVSSNGKSLMYGSTVYSIDNSWYLPQIKNLKAGHGYTLDPKEPELKVRRTPVYPLFYGLWYTVFGEQTAHQLIPYVQSLLFAISAVLICLSVFNMFGDPKWALVTGFTYGLLPFIPAFCYYTLTEAIAPFLVVWSVYLFSSYHKKRKWSLLVFCGLVTALCFLNRPMAGAVLVGFCLYVIFEGGLLAALKKKFVVLSVLGIGFLIGIAPWVVRNYIVSNEIIIAEKFYHGDPMDYGRAHIELRYLTSTWTNPANLSTEVFSNTLRFNIDNGSHEKNIQAITDYVNQWPDDAFSGYSREELNYELVQLDACFFQKALYRKAHPAAIRKDFLNLDCEDRSLNGLHRLHEKFIKESPFRYYVVTPLRTFKELAFNSNLHGVAMLNPNSQELNLVQFGLKTIAYLLNALLFLSLIYFWFSKRVNLNTKLLLTIPMLLIAYAIFFVFRYAESRYLLPIYPLLIISFGFMISELYGKIVAFRRK